MKHNKARFHSLSRRIVTQFCLFTLFLSVLYGMFSFVLLYTLEDSFIERDIVHEASYLQQGYDQNQQWPAIRNNYMSLHFSEQTLPENVRRLLKDEPRRKEFYGEEGRHYHLYPMPGLDNTYLLAEVSKELLVRPIRAGILKFLIISGIVLTLLACGLAWWISRKTIKPLKELADLVEGVAPEQIPERFSADFPNNEIGILAQALEQSMQRISDSLNREKCFTRDVSHELRTPLAVVKNACEVMAQRSDLNDVQSQTVNRIAEANMQMEQTVNTLLVLAREEHTAANQEATDLMAMIEQSVINHGYLLDGKSVEVEIDDSCRVVLNTQPGMLKVLLDNLLANAFQYTESGYVNTYFHQGVLHIKDTGIGIAEDISDRLTQPAVKGSQSTGFGFGMAIVQRLCDHLGWQLRVESNTSENGSGGTLVSVKIDGTQS